MLKDTLDLPFVFYPHRISYGETDTMGVLYYAEYAHIFERARNEFARACGVTYKSIEERGFVWPVSEFYCKYKKPACYDDLVQVCVAITEWRGASLKFMYEMYDEKKETVLASAYSLHACVNLQGKPVRIPDWMKASFDVLQK